MTDVYKAAFYDEDGELVEEYYYDDGEIEDICYKAYKRADDDMLEWDSAELIDIETDDIVAEATNDYTQDCWNTDLF